MADAKASSPCTGVCTLDDEDKYCIGCYRSRVELANWRKMSDEERDEAMVRVEGRIKDLAEGRKIAV
ncbi:hypothetical protein MTBPR1_110077 [Candidatus Terasakiella magnetica]|uniref:Fe-S protein n=1 Tax=Candidatus Terasakiella magnetica TaxID=1867952 RepID=A0A1C3REH6_9PROT|nr:DUF1289 domain-containing protein [Candidatus Terasakiella magnetica]SCA55638.1 hypothetical protein MTBPR1_110077 [Candidatus Terasakiella magnetica]